MIDWVGTKTVEEPHANEKLTMADRMAEAFAVYKTKIGEDYENWTLGSRALLSADNIEKRIRENSVVEFKNGISYKCGSKYIKVTKNLGDQTSVHSFIVNTHDDKKFNYGDILKAASWKAPARNFSRGNIFEEYKVKWTGAI
tara:strand:+ start:96 stop:521 length:426 start_codon:yes stop_codon:yes gene_type:complete